MKSQVLTNANYGWYLLASSSIQALYHNWCYYTMVVWISVAPEAWNWISTCRLLFLLNNVSGCWVLTNDQDPNKLFTGLQPSSCLSFVLLQSGANLSSHHALSLGSLSRSSSQTRRPQAWYLDQVPAHRRQVQVAHLYVNCQLYSPASMACSCFHWSFWAFWAPEKPFVVRNLSGWLPLQTSEFEDFI